MKKMNISYLLSSALLASSLSLYPITSNDVEKGFAVATVFPDIAAHYFDTTDHKTTAALCHITTDTLSLLNKGMFIYNNLRIQRATGNFSLDRDIVVNSIWTARDLSLFIKHVHDLVAPQEKLPELDYDSETDRDEDSDGQEAVIDQANEDSEKAENDAVDNDEIDWLSVEKNKKGSADNNTADEKTQSSTKSLTSIEGIMSTVVIPVLKGYTAYALSWWQGPRHEDKLTRNIWVAAHSLTKLIDEYGMLDAKSSYKNGVIALIIINGIWLAKEIKNCRDHEAFVAEQARLRRAQEAERLRLAAEEERRRIAAVREAERLRREREAEEARRRGDAVVNPNPLDPQLQQDQLNARNGAHPIDRLINLPANPINEEQAIENLIRVIDEHEQALAARVGADAPQPLPAPVANNVECPLCLEDGRDLIRIHDNHRACSQCINRGAIVEIVQNASSQVRCPSCVGGGDAVPNPHRFNAGQIRGILNTIRDDVEVHTALGNNQRGRNDVINLYNLLHNRTIPGAVPCQTEGCHGLIVNQNHLRAEMACPDCNNVICTNCGVQHALNIPCIRARFETLPVEQQARIRRSENRTLCPRCFTPLDRNAACNHMTCGADAHNRPAVAGMGCGYDFCLYCHTEDGRGHVPGCPQRWFNNTPEGRGERVDPE